MDLEKIKNCVKHNGDKFIFVENGEPEVVMMSWQEYQKLAQHNPKVRMASELSESRSDNSDAELGSFGLRAGSQETESVQPIIVESVGLPVRLEDIHLEDLPI